VEGRAASKISAVTDVAGIPFHISWWQRESLETGQAAGLAAVDR